MFATFFSGNGVIGKLNKIITDKAIPKNKPTQQKSI